MQLVVRGGIVDHVCRTYYMITDSKRMEKNTEHVVKSCRNLVQTEIKTLRTDLGNLRGFLRNCQDTINSETTRLETKCLGKIESLEEERSNFEKVIVNMKEENQSLQESLNALLTKLKDTERDLQHSQEESLQLRVHMKSLESQLTTKTTQCKDFCKKLEASKLQCLSLENKLASNETYVKEQKSILNEMASDNKHLECSTKDLQIRAAESEEYEKALESHIEELEAICSILREQHDEQRKYFLQKESTLKRESQDIQRNLENENKKLTHKLELMTTKLQNESSKSFELQEIKNKQEKCVQSKEEMIIELDDKIDTLKHELQIEKATIEMLNRKNSDLTEEVAKLNTQLSVIEEKANSTEQLVNRRALKEIGNTVQQYIDDNSSLAKKLENTLIASNNEKLEECERQLVFERQKRLNAEMDAANLSVELEKAKVEIAVYRNSMSDSTRNRSIQISKSHMLALPGLAKTSSTSSLNFSNPLPIKPNRELLPTASPEMLRNQPDNLSNGSNSLPGVKNGVADEERSLFENDSRSTTSDINNAVSLAEISISDRASRKMEEARRKAMVVMNVIRIFVPSGFGSGCQTQIRWSHFIRSHDGESLWKSVRAETGKVGGRGKRTKKRKAIDLGAGKILGEGKAGILWPGLNVPVNKPLSQRTEEEQQKYEESRSERSTKIQRSKDNSNRGWSGGLWGGQRLIPDANETIPSNFDAYLLQAARVSHMIASVGRVYSIRALVVVGNGDGTFGVGMQSSHDVTNAARKARVKALKRLQFIDRYEDRTVFEDMYVNHHRTFMHIRQQPEGYGLRCHRVVSTMCKVIGIKDLYVRTYGATTPLSVVKCFVKSLHTQETHQQKADRLGYHVVQFDPLRDNFPHVLASPKNGTKEEPYDEYLEYLRQPLITRVVKKKEGYCQHEWTNILYQTNQGPPIPIPANIPAKFRDVRNSQLD